MRRQILPVLVKSLQSLRPTREEIERVLGELRQVRQRIGRKLKVSDVLDYPASSEKVDPVNG